MAGGLKRRVGVVLLTFYGVGIMIGAGIYVLVGIVADVTGIYAPLAFLFAGLIAVPTALSYSELVGRVPKAGGEAAFVRSAFGSPTLARIVGLVITLASIVAAAAILRGGVGYATMMIPINPALLTTVFGLGLVAVAIAGAMESLLLAAAFTVIEVIGLAIVAYVGLTGPVSTDWQAAASLSAHGGYGGLAQGVIIAFFAFIGFENMVNMAEETIEPHKNIPLAILIALAVTALLYAIVTIAVVRTADSAQLAASSRPIALVYELATGRNAGFLAVIAAVAALNGVLAQIVMASRILFGLGHESKTLSVFARAHPKLGTPVLATALAGGSVISAAIFLPVQQLTETTSILQLGIFVLVNLALLVLKRRHPSSAFRVSGVVPWIGMFTSLGALAMALVLV